jgi:hypothetical protein
MRKTTTVLFACRLDVTLVDKIRELAHKNRRTIGEELARILDYALPAIIELEKSMELAKIQAFRQQREQRIKEELKIQKSAGRR